MNETLENLKEKTKCMPKEPGVYIMKDKNNKIIYIGKAKNLKARVSQYFQSEAIHDLKTTQLVSNIKKFEYIITTNEYEALVLECNLIKINTPKYNILLKDSKGFHFIKIKRDIWPRMYFTPQNEDINAEYIGPFMDFKIRNLFYEILYIFKLATCNRVFYDLNEKKYKLQKPCLNFYINKCSAPCYGLILKEEYIKNFNMAIEMLRNPQKDIIKKIENEMLIAAKEERFERALFLRDIIKSILKLKDKQKIISTKIKNQDVIAFAKNSKKIQVQIFIFRNGNLVNAESFSLQCYGSFENLEDKKSEFLISYYDSKIYNENIIAPDFITLDGKISYICQIKNNLSSKFGKNIKFLFPKKGEQFEILNMCLKNAIETLNKSDRIDNGADILFELSKILKIDKIPFWIESYDVSHFSGKWAVGYMVVFKNSKPFKSAYRRFRINNISKDDYASIKEILKRRFLNYLNRDKLEKNTKNSFHKLPDIILIDGGIGHTKSAKEVLLNLNLDIPTFGMVKDANHKTKALTTNENVLDIKSNENVFKFITKIQEETHKFAINYHRYIRNKY